MGSITGNTNTVMIKDMYTLNAPEKASAKCIHVKTKVKFNDGAHTFQLLDIFHVVFNYGKKECNKLHTLLNAINMLDILRPNNIPFKLFFMFKTL